VAFSGTFNSPLSKSEPTLIWTSPAVTTLLAAGVDVIDLTSKPRLGVPNSFAQPVNPCQLVLMGKIVMRSTSKCFFQSVAQPLRQMFCCGGNRELVAVPASPFQNASQRIILGGSFGFVIQELLDLFMMRDKEGAI
jgi:hypothetical protein